MNKFHIAISTKDLQQTRGDYTRRLGKEPCVYVPNAYALWRTDSLNFSVRQEATASSGQLRHLGWEDASAAQFATETDANGIVWEKFTAQQQADEINDLWPETNYKPT